MWPMLITSTLFFHAHYNSHWGVYFCGKKKQSHAMTQHASSTTTQLFPFLSRGFKRQDPRSWTHVNSTSTRKPMWPTSNYFHTKFPSTLQFSVVVGSILLWKEKLEAMRWLNMCFLHNYSALSLRDASRGKTQGLGPTLIPPLTRKTN